MFYNPQVPWATCNNEWNTPRCGTLTGYDTADNGLVNYTLVSQNTSLQDNLNYTLVSQNTSLQDNLNYTLVTMNDTVIDDAFSHVGNVSRLRSVSPAEEYFM